MAWREFTFFVFLRSVSACDQTDITQSLNGKIAAKQGAVYGGGKGVLIRNLNDGYTNDTSKKVVPASLLVNDIMSASIAYPAGSPFCPYDGWNGYQKQTACKEDPWLNAVVAVVIGGSMAMFFKDFEKIQDSHWGWGVFYGTDSNSADMRCRWLPEYDGWDCPGYWLDGNGTATPNPQKKGAGSYDWGNPNAMLPGGGAGCHFSQDGAIDQFDSDKKPNLVRNRDCECNYDLKGNGWQNWVEQWIKHGKAKPSSSWMGWFEGGTKKAPNWAVDNGMCWVNNPRDMIYLQNMVWLYRNFWSNQLEPKSRWTSNPGSQRYYWGWNEVPVDSEAASNPQNWDAIVIKLPAAICPLGRGKYDTIKCLSHDAQRHLQDQLAWYENNGYLKLGAKNIPHRPSSYVVLLREWLMSENHWQRDFFCENWVSSKYKIVFRPLSWFSTGVCYVDKGHQVGTPGPTQIISSQTRPSEIVLI